MQFVKASIRLPEHVSNDLYIRNIKTKGQVEPGYFRSYAGKSKIDGWQLENFEWLDESPPASAVEEAARMYPDLAGEPYDLINKVQQEKRQAHITCAGMYTDTIDKLKAENSKMRKALEIIRDTKSFTDPDGFVRKLATETLKTL